MKNAKKIPRLLPISIANAGATVFFGRTAKSEPKVSAYNIKSGISNQCFNIPCWIRFKKCEGYGNRSYNRGYNAEQGISFEEYCQCVSNNYAIQLDLLEDRFARQTSNKFMTSSHLRYETPCSGDKKIWERLDK